MLKKIVGSICLIMVMFALVGCDSLAGLGFGSFGDDTQEKKLTVGEVIYNAAKKKGYDYSYDDFLDDINNQYVEIAVNENNLYIKLDTNDTWKKLISFADIEDATKVVSGLFGSTTKTVAFKYDDGIFQYKEPDSTAWTTLFILQEYSRESKDPGEEIEPNPKDGCLVTFKLLEGSYNGSFENIEVVVPYGGTVEKIDPNFLKRDGYTFNGWLTSDNDYYDFYQQIYSDMVIYAYWVKDTPNTEKTYYIYYNDVRGNVMLPNRFNGGEIVKIPNAEADGYKFLGWIVDGNSGIYYCDYTIMDRFGDIYLTAVYEDCSNMITKINYETYGGNHENPIEVCYGDVVILNSANKPFRNFVGWYLDDKFTQKIEILNRIEEPEITLYAKYENDYIYSAEFDLFGSSQIYSIGVDCGSIIPKNETTVSSLKFWSKAYIKEIDGDCYKVVNVSPSSEAQRLDYCNYDLDYDYVIVGHDEKHVIEINALEVGDIIVICDVYDNPISLAGLNDCALTTFIRLYNGETNVKVDKNVIKALGKEFLKDFNEFGNHNLESIEYFDTSYIDSSWFVDMVHDDALYNKWGWLYDGLWQCTGDENLLINRYTDFDFDKRGYYITNICGFFTMTLHDDSGYKGYGKDFSNESVCYIVLRNMPNGFLDNIEIEEPELENINDNYGSNLYVSPKFYEGMKMTVNNTTELVFGVNAFNSIQEAINKANVDDIIRIFYGLYDENILIDKRLILIGNIDYEFKAGDSYEENEYSDTIINGNVEVACGVNDVVLRGLVIVNQLILNGNNGFYINYSILGARNYNNYPQNVNIYACFIVIGESEEIHLENVYYNSSKFSRFFIADELVTNAEFRNCGTLNNGDFRYDFIRFGSSNDKICAAGTIVMENCFVTDMQQSGFMERHPYDAKYIFRKNYFENVPAAFYSRDNGDICNVEYECGDNLFVKCGSVSLNWDVLTFSTSDSSKVDCLNNGFIDCDVFGTTPLYLINVRSNQGIVKVKNNFVNDEKYKNQEKWKNVDASGNIWLDSFVFNDKVYGTASSDTPMATITALSGNKISGSKSGFYAATSSEHIMEYTYRNRLVISKDGDVYSVIILDAGKSIPTEFYEYRIAEESETFVFDSSLENAKYVKIIDGGEYITFEFYKEIQQEEEQNDIDVSAIDKLAKEFLKDFNNFNNRNLVSMDYFDTGYFDSSWFTDMVHDDALYNKWSWLYDGLWQCTGEENLFINQYTEFDFDKRGYYITNICGFFTMTLHDDTCYNGFGKDFSDKELCYIVLKNMPDSFLGDFGIE